MKGNIYNREKFLQNISRQLKRENRIETIPSAKWSYAPQEQILKGANKDELLKVLQKQCEEINTEFIATDQASLSEVLEQTIKRLGGGPIVTWKDERFSKWGVAASLQEAVNKHDISLHEWEASAGEKNIQFAEGANIGITISDITLAESGTAVLFSSHEHGRVVSFLPLKSIILIPKSSIVPRMTQAAKMIRKEINEGKKVASCINFISGPSNSADIEMNLVVGVHGPMEMTYIVIEDV